MRTEIIKANNSNHMITITKKEEEITIEFDFELVPEIAPRFTLPLWAAGKEEEYEFIFYRYNIRKRKKIF